MSSEYQTAETLDVKGKSYPMPVVKTGQAIDDLEVGDVLEEPAIRAAPNPLPTRSTARPGLAPLAGSVSATGRTFTDSVGRAGVCDTVPRWGAANDPDFRTAEAGRGDEGLLESRDEPTRRSRGRDHRRRGGGRRGKLRVEPREGPHRRGRDRDRRSVPRRRDPGARGVHEPVPRRREPAGRRATVQVRGAGDSGHGGTTGKVVTAASGIEIALWDAAGKLLDLPVYQLLGSRYRDRVRIYCDCHAGEAYAVDDGGFTEYADAEAYTPEAYAAEAERVVDTGFDAIKFDLDMARDNDPDPYNGRLTNAALDHKVAVVEAVREAIGDGIDLAFDCHWDYTVESATRLARRLEPYDLMWLEDVVPPEEIDAQREVARRTETPLATGENRFRIHELSDLLDEYAVDVITPDPTTCGGLAESKRIAERAEERYVPFSPHNVCSPVGTMACVHLCAAVPNADVLEYHALEVDWWDDLLARDDPLIDDGYVDVPTEPGLGIELNEAAVREHALPGTDGFD